MLIAALIPVPSSGSRSLNDISLCSQVPKTASAHVLAPGPSMADKAVAGSPAAVAGRKRKQSIGDKTESLAMVDRWDIHFTLHYELAKI